jgi:hypothetical protein
MGGLVYDTSRYVKMPDEWLQTAASSFPLFKGRASDGRILLGEWTRLRRLEEEWPMEERMALTVRAQLISGWGVSGSGEMKDLFQSVRRVRLIDYEHIREVPIELLVVFHHGEEFRLPAAHWLGLNPLVGLEMGWQLSPTGLFRWTDSTGYTVAESLFWQDGPFEMHTTHEYVEVGSGWLVVITQEGYDALIQRYGALASYGAINRALGWLGQNGTSQVHSLLDT